MVATDSLIIYTLYYLAAAVIAVPIFKKLGLGSILGYLVAGIILGPSVTSLIHDPEHVLHFAEFGVIMLLFLIGLELAPEKLWQLRIQLAVTGGSQLLLSALLLSLALIALQMKISQAVLLGFPWPSMIVGPAAILAVLIVGRYALDPLLNLMAQTNSREIMTAAGLLIVLGLAVLMKSVGLSMGLGAFIAGILLANSKFRHQLESDIEPFKGILLGLFFIAVGMTMNIGLLLSKPWKGLKHFVFTMKNYCRQRRITKMIWTN